MLGSDRMSEVADLVVPVLPDALQTPGLFPGVGNNLAWFVVRAPDRSPTDYGAALELIDRALRRDPLNRAFVSTRGVALYRVGRDAARVQGLKPGERERESQALRGVARRSSFGSRSGSAHLRKPRRETARKTHRSIELPASSDTPAPSFRKSRLAVRVGREEGVEVAVTVHVPALAPSARQSAWIPPRSGVHRGGRQGRGSGCGGGGHALDPFPGCVSRTHASCGSSGYR